jgi:NAD(P)-dependent dehydrogenase (short-subunit alcohol dehydrogenase family)
VGPILLFNLFAPALERGRPGARKGIAITTGLADLDLTIKYEHGAGVPYSISKVALNMAVAKLGVAWAPRGVLFMGISPGVVDTNNYTPST